MTDQAFDLAALRRVGMIQQKQTEYFALRLHTVGGDLTAGQLQAIAQVAERYGKGSVHLSTRQGVEIHNVHHSNLEKARGELARAGVEMGACGPRIRIIVACPGAATCRWGSIDTKKVARDLDAKHFRQETPHKLKMGVTGCPHNCAKAKENDVGVMGAVLPGWTRSLCTDCKRCLSFCPAKAIAREEDGGRGRYVLDERMCIHCSICTGSCPVGAWVAEKKGYDLFIGGTIGKQPRLGTLLKPLIATEEELYGLIERALSYYRANGRKRERLGHMMDRVGVDQIKEAILDGRVD